MSASGEPASKGRILAVKWGLNPNSSSLGVDVTFFLFGATALALATPFVSALVRWRRPVVDSAIEPSESRPVGDADVASEAAAESHEPDPPA